MKEVSLVSKFKIFSDSSELNPEEKEMLEKAIEARDAAYAVYSDFLVGACVLLDNGSMVTGNNQENAAYPSGMCAERIAIWHAASQYPKARIKSVFISAKSNLKKVSEPIPPCGGCRQTLAEYEFKQDQPIAIYFTGESGEIVKSNSLRDLLPFTFSKKVL